MIVRKPTETGGGLAPSIGIEGAHPRMLMDVATLRLAAGDSHSNDADRERAFLLLRGEVDFLWSGGRRRATRESYLEEEPWVLHVPARAEVKVVATEGEAELVVQGVRNDRSFPVRLYGPGECRSEEFGAGTMQETSTRLVRTIFDAATAPHSQMVLGEVVNHPGKWSSYPPHHHPQPEVYHYRFSLPEGLVCAFRERSRTSSGTAIPLSSNPEWCIPKLRPPATPCTTYG